MAFPEIDFAHVIAVALSIITIGVSFISKVPQIRTVLQKRSTRGISLLSLYMDVCRKLVLACYNFCKGYPALSYLEYPALICQQSTLMYLVLKYNHSIDRKSIAIAAVTFLIPLLFATQILPSYLLVGMLVSVLSLSAHYRSLQSVCLSTQPFCSPVSGISKLVQVYEILRKKDASAVNLTTWFLTAFTSLSELLKKCRVPLNNQRFSFVSDRIYTVAVESGDKMLLANFIISFSASSAVFVAAYYYKEPKRPRSE